MTQSFPNLSEWLAYLEAHPPAKQSAKAHFNQAKEMVKRLGIHQIADYVMVVTGTNGKGSVVACLEKLAMTAGKTVGTITSPHLIHFNERIKINGKPVSDDVIYQAYHQIERAKQALTLNYIQYAYLAGLLILQQEKLDLAVLEVGIGGRYDVMNAVDNQMTIITNVDYDHCDLLGDTREAIGAEKAGLIRPGTPVVIGDRACPLSIIGRAKQQAASLFMIGDAFDYAEESVTTWFWHGNNKRYDGLMKPPIILSNASTALQAFSLYDPIQLSHEVVTRSLSGLLLAGRCQLIHDRCYWLLDVAHNPQAVDHLARYVRASDLPKKRVVALFGMYRDKDIAGSLAKIVDQVDEWHICHLPVARSATIDQMAAILAELKVENLIKHADPLEGYQAVKRKSQPDDLIIVFGSFVMIGMISSYLKEQGD